MEKMLLTAFAALAFTAAAHADAGMPRPAPMRFLPPGFCATLRHNHNPDAQRAASLYCPPAADPAAAPLAPAVPPGHVEAAAF
jgi:hypothetical protein